MQINTYCISPNHGNKIFCYWNLSCERRLSYNDHFNALESALEPNFKALLTTGTVFGNDKGKTDIVGTFG
jgi:hypothetical protein